MNIVKSLGKLPPSWLLIGGAAVVLVGWAAVKAKPGQSLAGSMAQNVVGGAAEMVGDAISGAIEGLEPKVNPASDQNFIYHDIIGAIGRSASNDQDWSLGGWIYDVTH